MCTWKKTRSNAETEVFSSSKLGWTQSRDGTSLPEVFLAMEEKQNWYQKNVGQCIYMGNCSHYFDFLGKEAAHNGKWDKARKMK